MSKLDSHRAQLLRRAVGRKVESYRQLGASMSQKALAARCDMSRASISAVENGKQGLSLEALYNLAEELRVSPSDLLPGQEELGAGRSPQQVADAIMEEIRRG